MNVAIVGTGYVGLVTGVCLATVGHRVTCVDEQPGRISAIARAEAPFYEPGLDELLREALDSGRFSVSRNTPEAVRGAEVVMLSVGTPSIGDRIDLSQLGDALRQVGAALGRDDIYRVVVVKSTVVPGTTDDFALPILEHTSRKLAGKDFGLAMNPEFLREGSAIRDFQEPDRIIIGQYDDLSGTVLRSLYEPYDCPKFRTGLRNAEMIKYASNALLATLISFSNELAGVCEAVPETDIEAVMDGLHLDRRLSPTIDGRRIAPGILAYLRAGCGFGGSCLPKDVRALYSYATEKQVAMPLLQAVLDVNAARPAALLNMLRNELGDVAQKTIGILGLAFKAGTDDLRESSSLRLADALLQAGAEVRAFDPVALSYAHNKVDERIAVAVDAATLFASADAVVLTTSWPEFAAWSWNDLVRNMRTPLIVDGRNALRSIRWSTHVTYRPIGTAKTTQATVMAVG